MSSAETSPTDKSGALRLIAGGGGARLIGLPVGAICSALTAYLVIRYVGDEHYGYVNLVATLFLLMPFADFGLGVVVINAISRVEPGAAPSDAELRLVWRVLTRLTAIAITLSVAVLLVAVMGGWTAILNIPPNLVGGDYATAAALSISFLAIPLGIGQRIMVGLGRVGEMTLIAVTAPIATTLTTILLIHAAAPPMYLAVGPAVGILSSNAVLSWRALEYMGARLTDLRSASPSGPAERLAHSALSYFIVSLGIPVAMQSHRLVLAHLSSASELSAYSIMAQIYVPVLSIITTGAVALWPAYKRKGADTRKLWASSMRMLTILGVGMGLAFWLGSPFLARLISSNEIQPSALLAGSFGALIAVMAVHQASGLLLTDESGLRFQAYCVIFLATASVMLSIMLVKPLGASGPVIASVVAIFMAQLLPGIVRAQKVLGRPAQ